MPEIPARHRHNDRVTPPRSARRALVAALLAPALLLSGCGGGEAKAKPSTKPSVALPTGDVKVPEGVELTKAGTELSFGQAATVAYEPNPQRSSVLSMSVDSVQEARISDFAAYDLKPATKASRPYYVKVTVKNVGQGDLSKAEVPLLAQDNRNALIQRSSFNNTFKRCPSTPLPDGFAPTKTATLCLVYLVPAGGTLTAMSFRPLQAFEAILWKGTIQPPVVEKKPKKKTKNKKKG